MLYHSNAEEQEDTCTISAIGLGTLAMTYATKKLQNPLPRTRILCEGDMNNPARKNDAFYVAKVCTSDSTLYDGGKGFALPLLTQKMERNRKILEGIGVPSTFARHCT